MIFPSVYLRSDEVGWDFDLISSLRIDDEEDGNVLSLGGDLCGLGERKLNYCLACKVLSSKAMPREVCRSQILQILQVVENVNVELIGTNLFIVEFSSLHDHQIVLKNGPWNLFSDLYRDSWVIKGLFPMFQFSRVVDTGP